MKMQKVCKKSYLNLIFVLGMYCANNKAMCTDLDFEKCANVISALSGKNTNSMKENRWDISAETGKPDKRLFLSNIKRVFVLTELYSI
jgi:hypothetical protein